MSQSPLQADAAPETTVRYQQGWQALNRLLHEDRSFSGGERNCAFLNCGGKEFADISAASGFDFPDDARAVAASDWDFDGDLDLWVTCRTAPRLRLLKNASDTPPSTWLALRLEGDGRKVNRDAVGARAEVWLQGATVPLLRTVHGGDSFLSQTSAWLHFGLGEDARLGKVIVRWPGGIAEEIGGVEPGGFHVIKFGSGSATRWQPPTERAPLVAAPQTPLPDEATARIVLTARLPMPALAGVENVKGPLLLNVWSSTCPPCIAELSEWSKEIGRLEAAGLRVVALNADEEPPLGGKYPFETGMATPELVQALDLFQRAVLDRWLPLPVPSSFLIDQAGRAAVIYKGPVSVEQILSDCQLLDAPPDTWRASALPFPGRFINPPPSPSPLRVSSQFIDAAQPREALRYLESYAAGNKIDAGVADVIGILRAELLPDAGAALLANADALRDSGDITGAIAAYQDTLRQSPRTLDAAAHLAWILASHPDASVRNPEEARALADRLCQISGQKNPAFLDLLAAAQAASGDFDGAKASALAALKLLGDSPDAIPIRERLALYEAGKTFVR